MLLEKNHQTPKRLSSRTKSSVELKWDEKGMESLQGLKVNIIYMVKYYK